MIDRHKYYWIIVDKDGNEYPLSINRTKKDCISKFPVHMLPGYKCIKVSVHFKSI